MHLKKKIGFRSTGICIYLFMSKAPLQYFPFSSLVWGSPCLLNGERIFDCIAWDMCLPAMLLITILWMRIFISLPDMLPTLRYDDFFSSSLPAVLPTLGCEDFFFFLWMNCLISFFGIHYWNIEQKFFK